MILRSWTALCLLGLVASAQAVSTFRFPAPERFQPRKEAVSATVQPGSGPAAAFSMGRHGVAGPAPGPSQIVAVPESDPGEEWVFTDRVVLQLEPGLSVEDVLKGRPLTLARSLGSQLFILQAVDAATAWNQASELSVYPGIVAAYPVPHAPKSGRDAYAAAPQDEAFPLRLEVPPCEIAPGLVIPGQTVEGQWYLENRDPETGDELGVDINVRPAWAHTRGAGITVAVADTGVETTHPDLAASLQGAPHFNFSTGLPEGSPARRSSAGAHGTSAAGLVAAVAGNGIGMSGVAPDSRLASWVIYDANGRSVSTEKIGDMFRYASNVVSVQNHSWGPTGTRQRGPDALENAGMESAWTAGRNGLGSVMVFAGGNDRATGAWANDNGFASDPRVIGVAGAGATGRATGSSEPGSSLLLAAPTGDDVSGGLFTTDLLDIDGANFVSFCPPFEHLSSYRWGNLGFMHTSAAAPLVSGIAALTLSINPGLTARDVQQVLLLSARHVDLADPDVTTNAAGLAVSHNVGFGIVDAAEAVRLAGHWSNRPSLQRQSRTQTGSIEIPDGGLRVEVQGAHVPAEIAYIPGISGFGIQPDRPMASLPLVDVGRATAVPGVRLDGKGALIERGDVLYETKLANVAAAGAAFAVVYNLEVAGPGSCPGGDQLCVPTGTDYSPIPVIFIGRTAGLALRDQILAFPDTGVRIALVGAGMEFEVSEKWQCERVGLRLKTDHTVRGDLRVTLTSPRGSTSILQRYNGDMGVGPVDWTYWTTHHYYEPSAGRWTLAVTDEAPGEGTGSVLEATLILEGVPIADGDGDGLDDSWEQVSLGSLQYGPADDPDEDGYTNLRESLEGSNPLLDELAGSPDVAFFNEDHVRVSWPGRSNQTYRLWSGGTLGQWTAPVNVTGRFPVTADVIPVPAEGRGFFRVETLR